MKVIIVSGTPGTGKTELAKALAKELSYRYVDVSKIIAENKLSDGYDDEKKCEIIDTKKLTKFIVDNIIKKSKKGLVIDSHLSHFLPSTKVDFCVITKCDLKVLEKRLKNKGYDKEKIRENMDSEIFDICLEEAKEKKHNILVIDTTKKVPQEIAKQLKPEILRP